MKMKWLTYVRNSLSFTVPEWTKLTAKDKEDLKQYAVEEGKVLGIAIEV
jgi:hypothetical protein